MSGLKPYRGKPDVRNFREGRGNGMHGLVAICHEVRKDGYTGSHWPKHNRASSLPDSRVLRSPAVVCHHLQVVVSERPLRFKPA